jgi:hypothetical protein
MPKMLNLSCGKVQTLVGPVGYVGDERSTASVYDIYERMLSVGDGRSSATRRCRRRFLCRSSLRT